MTLHQIKKLPLWPSHAERWINCSGQPRVALAAKTAIGDRQNPFAAEGTAAHAYLEARLTGKELPRIVDDSASNAEQTAIVEEAAENIEFIQNLGDFEMLVEQYLQYDLARHPVNCKVDVLLYNRHRVIVIDYKHGQGWKVNCRGNPQMMLYALAAYRKFPGRAISVAINQPRGVGEGFVEYEVPPEELTAWADTFEAAAARVYAHRAEYVIGPWCQGCPGMHGICPSVLSETIDVIAEMPQPGSVDVFSMKRDFRGLKEAVKNGKIEIDPEQIKSAEVADAGISLLFMPWWILDVAQPVREFVKTVEADADAELWERRPVPGWELRESKGRRAWLDPEEVPAILAEKLGGSPDDYCKTKKTPIGITEAEKLAKKHLIKLDSLMHAEPVLKRVRADGLDWMTDSDGTGFDFD